eukprot:scaffold121776_cov17-Tisochrysis_lutea.AAC.1
MMQTPPLAKKLDSSASTSTRKNESSEQIHYLHKTGPRLPWLQVGWPDGTAYHAGLKLDPGWVATQLG